MRQLLIRGLTCVVLLATMLSLITGFTGCRLSSAENAEMVKDRLDALYRSYLQGDIDQARRDLHESIPLLEKVEFPVRSASADGLFLSYSRLHALEVRAGNRALAEAYLLEARYWLLKREELSGATTEAVIQGIDSVDSEKLIEIVDKFDNAMTRGTGAKYVGSLIQKPSDGVRPAIE